MGQPKAENPIKSELKKFQCLTGLGIFKSVNKIESQVKIEVKVKSEFDQKIFAKPYSLTVVKI